MKAPALSRHGDEQWSISIDVRGVTAAIGTDVLGNFYRLFVAADRVVSLEDLVWLNHQHRVSETQAYDRNLHHDLVRTLFAEVLTDHADSLTWR